MNKVTHIKQSDKNVDRELSSITNALNSLIDKVALPSSSIPSDTSGTLIQAINIGNNLFSLAVKTQDGIVYSLPGIFKKSTSALRRGKDGDLLKAGGDGNVDFGDISVVGVVSNVTGSYPIVSTGGSAPDISIGQATNTSSGFLHSSDWILFSQKQESIVYGNAVLDANGSAVVETASVIQANRIFLTRHSGNSNMSIYVSAITAGVSFTITSAGGSDDASLDIGWMLI